MVLFICLGESNRRLNVRTTESLGTVCMTAQTDTFRSPHVHPVRASKLVRPRIIWVALALSCEPVNSCYLKIGCEILARTQNYCDILFKIVLLRFA